MTSSAYLTRSDEPRNMARFYVITLQPTLFGEWSVVREWGRIGRGGQVRETHHTTSQEAEDFATLLRQKKMRKGYRAI